MQPLIPQAPRKAPAPPRQPIEQRSPMRQPQFSDRTEPGAPTKAPHPGFESAGIQPIRLEGVAF